jgi:hypothetical protein
MDEGRWFFCFRESLVLEKEDDLSFQASRSMQEMISNLHEAPETEYMFAPGLDRCPSREGGILEGLLVSYFFSALASFFLLFLAWVK